MSLFGSPNTIGNGFISFVTRDFAHTSTYGAMAFPEPKNAKCIIVWAKNDGNTALGATEGIQYTKENRATLIVIYPVQTALAKKADIWLQIKPGQDGLPAMAMIHEIRRQELCDTDFIEKYTVVFAELQKTASDYPPNDISKLPIRQ